MLLLSFGLITFLAIIVTVPVGPKVTRADVRVLAFISDLRVPFLTSFFRGVDALFTSVWFIGIARTGVVVALLLFKRFRHLFVFMAAVLFTGWVTTNLALVFARGRPFGIEMLGHWQGSSMPSRPVAALAATMIGIVYTLVVPGRPRAVAKFLLYSPVALLAIARLYLGVDHPTDVAFGLIFASTISLVAFRTLTPNDVFPVSYGRGKAAHLDVSGERGSAIKRALADQLGLEVRDVSAFALGGSGGSTPIKLTLAGDEEEVLFAKLYATNHLRADRWYKTGRTLLYGRLEDEASFSTVRRLVQYEDYMLRVMRDAGIPTAEPYGFVELSPEREYLLVTGFFEDAVELAEAEVDDDVIDSGLQLVRDLWDAGVAHRDIKPSNLLLQNGRVRLIDVAFAEVRPSPWREAVDLANMMLVLALRSDPDRVYQRALGFFTPDDIGEAFAATHGVTIPSQSRRMLKEDTRPLVRRFRELAPPHRPVRIQRWSFRRVGAMLAVLASTLLALGLVSSNLRGAGLLSAADGTRAAYSLVVQTPSCEGEATEIHALEAQAMPRASMVPCVGDLPAGWSFRFMTVRDGSVKLQIATDLADSEPIKVSAVDSCVVDTSTLVPSDELGAQRFEKVETISDRYVGRRYYKFDGGCVIYDFDLAGPGRTLAASIATEALGFRTRTELADTALREMGVRLDP